MGRKCTVCNHDKVDAINKRLIRPSPNYSAIARNFSVGRDAVTYHQDRHLHKFLLKSEAAKEQANADDLMGDVREMLERLEFFMDKAEDAEDGEALKDYLGEWRQGKALLAKVAGLLQQEGQVNIYYNPQWIQIENTIINALQPYPEAREAVASALEAQQLKDQRQLNGRR